MAYLRQKHKITYYLSIITNYLYIASTQYIFWRSIPTSYCHQKHTILVMHFHTGLLSSKVHNYNYVREVIEISRE